MNRRTWDELNAIGNKYHHKMGDKAFLVLQKAGIEWFEDFLG